MKRRCATLLLAFIFLVVGLPLWKGNQTHYGISEGIYLMAMEEDGAQQPYLHFDMESNPVRFVFGGDMRMSFVHTGTVTLNGRVNLHCEKDGEKWVFKVVDNNTLRFVQKGSSEFSLKDGSLPDGALFQYIDEK